MTNDRRRSNRPTWLDDVVVMAGNWEPLAHRRRAVLGSADDADHYRREHSPEMVTALLEAGVTAVVWHFFKGFGSEHEKQEMEQSRRFGALCRKHGLRYGAYVNFGSLYAETFFTEQPQARQWSALDTQGEPHTYSEYFRCYYRQRPCLTQTEYVDYVARMTRHALDSSSEWIHFDNNAQMPCYCPRCRDGFRRFVQERYADPQSAGITVKQRFGHEHLDRLELPRGTARMGIDTLSSLHEPALQEWVDYRCTLLADAIGRVAQKINHTHPQAAIGANPTFDSGEFAPLVWGSDVEKVAAHVDLIFNEDGNEPRLTPDGRLIGHLFSFKFGQALGASILVHQPGATRAPVTPAHAALSLMEAAVFNRGNLGHVYHAADLLDGLRPDDARPQTVQFIRSHAEFFTRTEPIAEIALLYSHQSLVNDWARALPSRLLMEQTLARYGFQFDVVLESQLNHLDGYRLLILPNTTCMSDDAVAAVRRFVQNGGAVLATEDTATHDAWRRPRTAGDRRRQFGDLDLTVSVTGEHATRQDALADICRLSKQERERLFYLPSLESPQPFKPSFADDWWPLIDNRYWHLPINAETVAATIDTALSAPRLVHLSGPATVIPQLMRTSAGTLILHLLNYEPSNIVQDVPLTVDAAVLGDVKRLQTFTPDHPEPEDIDIIRRGDRLEINVPTLAVYRGVTFVNR